MTILLRILLFVALIYVVRQVYRTIRQGQGAPHSPPKNQTKRGPDSKKATEDNTATRNLEECSVCSQYIIRDSSPCQREDCPRRASNHSRHNEAKKPEDHKQDNRRQHNQMSKNKETASTLRLAFSASLALVLLLPMAKDCRANASSAGAAASDTASDSKPAAKAGGRYLVQVEGENAVVTLSLNGVDVERWVLKEKKAAAGASVNHWLRQGVNGLSLRVEPRPNRRQNNGTSDRTSSLSGTASGGSSLSLSSLTRAAMTGPVRVQAWFLGIAPDGNVSNIPLIDQDVPLDQDGHGSVGVRFGVPSSPALSLWLAENPPQTQPRPAMSTCLNFINVIRKEIATAYAEGKSPLEIDALALERQDAVRAYGGSTLQPALEISDESGDKSVRLTPPPKERELSLQPVAGTPLLRIHRKDGRPLIQAKAGKQEMVIQALLIGWMSGEWRVLRRVY